MKLSAATTLQDLIDEKVAHYIARRGELFAPQQEVPSGLSEKGEALAEILSQSDFGCQRHNVAALISTLIGEDLASHLKRIEDKKRANAIPGSDFIVIDERDGFELSGRPALLSEDTDGDNDYGLFSPDSVENPASYMRFGNREYRPANDEEIRLFWTAHFLRLSYEDAAAHLAPPVN